MGIPRRSHQHQQRHALETGNSGSGQQETAGFLSPEFIKREFPQLYQQQSNQQKHPAAQLQHFLNLLGNEGWELVETCQVGDC